MGKRMICPYCCKPIEWEENENGHPVAVDTEVFMFRKVREGEKGITVMTPRSELMKGITTKSFMYAWDFGQKVHRCYMAGRLKR